jgi:hypothetical protein
MSAPRFDLLAERHATEGCRRKNLDGERKVGWLNSKILSLIDLIVMQALWFARQEQRPSKSSK